MAGAGNTGSSLCDFGVSPAVDCQEYSPVLFPAKHLT
jgi:hypothetical protein